MGSHQSLISILDQEDRNYNFVSYGEEYRQLKDNQFTINSSSTQDIEQLFRELQDRYIEKIVYFCNSDDLTRNNINSLSQQVINPLLNLVKTIVKNNLKLDQLVLVTQGAISTNNSEPITELIQSTVWGLGKAIALEHPELNCTRIDLDPAITIEQQLGNLMAEISSKAPEIALRGNNRYLPRLNRYQSPHLLTSNKPSYLTVSNPGALDSLSLKTITRKQLNNHQVEIKIKATGLNFRDVLIALDLYPNTDKTLGCECAGEIVAIGNQVEDLQVGDQVIAIAPNTFGDYVTIERSLVARFPDYLSFTDAATIPVPFLTAYYALNYLGKISPGKRVLIHSAAGGVGQAAIQLAQAAGAEIFATASEGKWDYLKSLGVNHVMNSRSLDFAQEIQQITDGEGVDIVLNSLAGKFIPASLSVLKANGCFLEIGKLDIWDESQVRQQYPNHKYNIIDMVELCQQQPDLIQEMLSELMAKFRDRQLKPLPKQVFPLPQVVSAFRYLQQAKNIGKVVITPELTLEENASYLIAGGLGGLGILTAHWLAAKGAKNLLLLGRSNSNPHAQEEIAQLQQQGVNVEVIQTDITDYNALQNIVGAIRESPLRGVIHAAGILDDSAIQNMTWLQMERVLQPKVTGAWNLHNLTQDTNLDFFILFSSAVSLLGSPGQGNHVAANSFLDSLAHYRQSLGLPAMSINWGTWSDVGAAAEKQADQRLSQMGVNAIAPKSGIAILEQLFLSNASSLNQSAQIGVIDINWNKFLKQGQFSPFLSEFKQSQPQKPVTQIDLQAELEAVIPTDRRSLLLNSLRSELARVLGFQTSEVDTKTGFFDLGMDSLTAIEFKNRLQNMIGFTLPSTVAFDYPNLEALVDYILVKMFPKAESRDEEADIADLLAAALEEED
ncbi:MAG: SDR family NAD(P)-dependent oxidoreductase [Cyanobacteria bacterium J06558_2]